MMILWCFVLCSRHKNVLKAILFPWDALGRRQMAAQVDIRDNEDASKRGKQEAKRWGPLQRLRYGTHHVKSTAQIF